MQTQSPNKTEMTNPPLTETKMDKGKMEKCRLLRDCWIDRLGKLVLAGTEMDLNEAEVKEFCDTKFKGGPYVHTGESDGKAKRHRLVRAMRMTEVVSLERRRKQEEEDQIAEG